MNDVQFDAMIREMCVGSRVIAVFRDLRSAQQAFEHVRARCFERGIKCELRKSNGRMMVKAQGGSIRFTSERAELRGSSCEAFFIDETASFRAWMAPLIDKAK